MAEPVGAAATPLPKSVGLRCHRCAFEVLETGELTEPMRQAGVWRVLKKVRVFEVSPVLRGAGINTETLDVKGEKPADGSVQGEVKGATDEQLADYRKEFEKFMKTGQRLDG